MEGVLLVRWLFLTVIYSQMSAHVTRNGNNIKQVSPTGRTSSTAWNKLLKMDLLMIVRHCTQWGNWTFFLSYKIQITLVFLIYFEIIRKLPNKLNCSCLWDQKWSIFAYVKSPKKAAICTSNGRQFVPPSDMHDARLWSPKAVGYHALAQPNSLEENETKICNANWQMQFEPLAMDDGEICVSLRRLINVQKSRLFFHHTRLVNIICSSGFVMKIPPSSKSNNCIQNRDKQDLCASWKKDTHRARTWPEIESFFRHQRINHQTSWTVVQ